MPSERIQRQIDRLLDEAEQASAERDWATVHARCEHALTFDPDNQDAIALLAAANRGLRTAGSGSGVSGVGETGAGPAAGEDAPSSRDPERANDAETRDTAPNTRAGGWPVLWDDDTPAAHREPIPRGGQDAHAPSGDDAIVPAETRYPIPDTLPSPTAFVSGRYQVIRLLGEGGKKRVYLARDKQLDRRVAFALIKTEGLDQAGRDRIAREGQAMGRLGSHPHIVTVFDIGELPATSNE